MEVVKISQTKQEIRNEWDRVNLKRYNVAFHRTNDARLIDFVEKRKERGEQTTEIFREAVESLMQKEGK